ncbi:hypothetical protein JOF53_007370 [Crossiella equi]|uniref:Uncharacterized protein n=1 Tax=Crossiella equi TaxID=130796 RepID=A0ABS5APJ9_9PSEU|nr:hypothetical protein [Crossiella equi]
MFEVGPPRFSLGNPMPAAAWDCGGRIGLSCRKGDANSRWKASVAAEPRARAGTCRLDRVTRRGPVLPVGDLPAATWGDCPQKTHACLGAAPLLASPPCRHSLSRSRSLDGRHCEAPARRGGGGARSRAPTRQAVRARSPRRTQVGGLGPRSTPPGRPRRSRTGRAGRRGGISGHSSAAPKLAEMIASNSARTHTGSAQTSSAKPRRSVAGSRPRSVPAGRATHLPSMSITPRLPSPGSGPMHFL